MGVGEALCLGRYFLLDPTPPSPTPPLASPRSIFGIFCIYFWPKIRKNPKYPKMATLFLVIPSIFWVIPSIFWDIPSMFWVTPNMFWVTPSMF